MPRTDRPVFHFYPQHRDGATIYCLTGRITLEGIAQLRKAFWEAVQRRNTRQLVLVLDQVPELDPSALSLLIATKNLAAKHKIDLLLVGLNEVNRTRLEETHLDRYFTFHETLREALEAT